MKRPYILINCAMSADGKIALPNREQIRISSKEDIRRMYQLRNQSDAVLVGIGTVLSDNPKLTVKNKYVKNAKNPIRIILDSKCRIPNDSHVLDNSSKTYIVTSHNCNRKFGINIEILKCKKNKLGEINLEDLLLKLNDIGIKKLMVEGGGSVIWSFINNGFFDDLFVYMAPFIIGGGKTPTMTDGLGIKDEKSKILLKLFEIKKLGDGLLLHYKP
ncbi:MAG: 2,5-diamino-6-(ribosylamino)-4(3H)-pyrimidinone 5'-phosphate reductase [Candidatus Lokiarchaeia archaeon]|nr:2,5-diamino-6-(ribosylamino)-4(3H)-pyrimidinone 5'-phosphate reductase [Candidatus Lokiarchaeia archaeon]